MRPPQYVHYRVQTEPLAWQSVSDQIASNRQQYLARQITLYGIWRNQIGRPRDELNVILQFGEGAAASPDVVEHVDSIASVEMWPMSPTLRPTRHEPPQRQGNYAFRHFRTPPANWDEFLELCATAWPDFEASYPDCEIVGLWRYDGQEDGLISSLLLTRRPNLAAWERTKRPQDDVEAEVRRKLSRRYDLCISTYVHTATLLTASDEADTARWT